MAMATSSKFVFGLCLLCIYLRLIFVAFFAINDTKWIPSVADSLATEAQYPRKNSWAGRRFPLYGTAAFDRTCGFVERVSPSGEDEKCLFYATVEASSNEGGSAWASNVAGLFLYAAQAQCGIRIDYGGDSNVAVEEVLEPIDSAGTQRMDWTVPSVFRCSGRCLFGNEYQIKKFVDRNPRRIGVATPLAAVPKYRFTYNKDQAVRREDFANVTAALPGFQIETGMACAWGRLFQLSTNAASYRPDLYSRIWPIIHDDDAFVIALYIRTRNADNEAKNREKGHNVTKDTAIFQERYQKVVNCALQLEMESISSPEQTARYARSVWLVVSDSSTIAQHIASNYDTGSPRKSDSVVPRSVVSTASRGLHSKPENKPDTAAWADGFIDWFLIGESDAVVFQGSVSFGQTAALRSARPLYSESCEKLSLVKED